MTSLEGWLKLKCRYSIVMFDEAKNIMDGPRAKYKGDSFDKEYQMFSKFMPMVMEEIAGVDATTGTKEDWIRHWGVILTKATTLHCVTAKTNSEWNRLETTKRVRLGAKSVAELRKMCNEKTQLALPDGVTVKADIIGHITQVEMGIARREEATMLEEWQRTTARLVSELRSELHQNQEDEAIETEGLTAEQIKEIEEGISAGRQMDSVAPGDMVQAFPNGIKGKEWMVHAAAGLATSHIMRKYGHGQSDVGLTHIMVKWPKTKVGESTAETLQRCTRMHMLTERRNDTQVKLYLPGIVTPAASAEALPKKFGIVDGGAVVLHEPGEDGEDGEKHDFGSMRFFVSPCADVLHTVPFTKSPGWKVRSQSKDIFEAKSVLPTMELGQETIRIEGLKNEIPTFQMTISYLAVIPAKSEAEDGLVVGDNEEETEFELTRCLFAEECKLKRAPQDEAFNCA